MTQDLREKIIEKAGWAFNTLTDAKLALALDAIEAAVAAITPAAGEAVGFINNAYLQLMKEAGSWARMEGAKSETFNTPLFTYPPNAAERIASLEAENSSWRAQSDADAQLLNERAALISQLRAESAGKDAQIAELESSHATTNGILHVCKQDVALLRQQLAEASERLEAAEKAISGVIDWDKARNHIVPYRVRDPLRAALAKKEAQPND